MGARRTQQRIGHGIAAAQAVTTWLTKVVGNSMRKMLEEKLARFEELERAMLDPDVVAHATRMAAAAREHGGLAKLATKYRAFKQVSGEIAELQVMLKSHDPEEREMADSELPEQRARREKIWNELLDMTIGGEDANRTRCVMEIRAGTGGDEAALFARNLYEMYKRYAESHNWKMELLDASPTELGGFKDLTIAFEGDGVYRELQYESGGHRVQRVPETEAKGRIHTSAATVAVLPEPEDVEIDLKPDDYRKDIFHASGPGGQHVNKTASAVRLTHYESGIVVSMQDEKSQHKNLAKALRVSQIPALRSLSAARTREACQRTKESGGIGRPQPAHSHLQFSRKSRHGPSHQPDTVQTGPDPGRRLASNHRRTDHS